MATSIENISGMLPPQFVASTLPRIGGVVKHLGEPERAIGFGLPIWPENGQTHIIRGHRLNGDLRDLPKDWLDVQEFRKIHFITHRVPGVQNFPDFTIVHPSTEQAREAEQLQFAIWKNPSGQYPFDLYHAGGGAITNLTAVDNANHVVGFLLGFLGSGDKWMGNPTGECKRGYWNESQLAGVAEHASHHGIARALKWAQYEAALQRELRLIHWTVDPLQMKNAGLNYGLGAMAAEFTPNYYPFRNEKIKLPLRDSASTGLSAETGQRRQGTMRYLFQHFRNYVH